jgi:molybdopterin molybdotransferase
MAAVASCGCEPVWGGIVRDEEAELSRALSGNGAGERPVDAVVLSGGSSVGPHDLAPSIINRSFSPGVVLHGLAIKPGKPTILALDGARPVFGLPGHPASALVVFEILVCPLLRVLTGQVGVLMEPRPVVRAILERNLASSPGREDYIRVSLIDKGGVVYARPILGKSGLISTLVKADGMLRIPLEKGGIEAGETVEVTLFRS